eukprot:SAG11_NODE_494_length_8948_cov_2.882699_7_plen_177_part_00
MAKALRLLRMAKMLRLAKLSKVVSQHFSNSYGTFSEMCAAFALLGGILYAAHMLACCWYAVGSSSQLMPHVDGPVLTLGWVHREYCYCDEDAAMAGGSAPDAASCEPCTDADLGRIPASERYLAGSYRSLSCLFSRTANSLRVHNLPQRYTSCSTRWRMGRQCVHSHMFMRERPAE